MKIAYCFSGMIRQLNDCGIKWKEFLEKNPGDVYGHFWEKSDKNNPDDTVENFIRIFNPKKVELESFEVFKETTLDFILSEINTNQGLNYISRIVVENGNLFSMYYKVWKANQLSLNEHYDVIVRCRTDNYMNIDTKIEINDFVNVPTGLVRVTDWINSEGNIDQFAYGNRKNMNYYCVLYNYLTQYIYRGYYLIPHEHILRIHLFEKDLTIREIPYGIYSNTHVEFNSFINPKVEIIYKTSDKRNLIKNPLINFYLPSRSL